VLAGYPSKKTVVVSPVRRIEGKKTVFEADFVPPKLHSQLAPFKDHHVAYALELGAYQVANAAIRKFEGKKDVVLPLVSHNVIWRRFPSREKEVLIQIEPLRTEKTMGGTEVRYFRSRVLDKESKKTVFGNGEFGIAIIKKGQGTGAGQ
jgi:hypothetical protein